MDRSQFIKRVAFTTASAVVVNKIESLLPQSVKEEAITASSVLSINNIPFKILLVLLDRDSFNYFRPMHVIRTERGEWYINSKNETTIFAENIHTHQQMEMIVTDRNEETVYARAIYSTIKEG